MAEVSGIRPFDTADAAEVVGLLQLLVPYEPITVARLLQYEECAPARIDERRWVSVEAGRVVGWATGGLHLWTGASRVGAVFVGVHPDHRGLGIGDGLFAVVEAHLRDLGVERLETSLYGEAPATRRFLEGRGFTQRRRAQVWRLNPAAASLGDLPERETRAAREGLRIETLGAYADRPEAMHALYADTLRDVPAEATFNEVRFEEFLCYRFRDPMLSQDGSVVVTASDRPVAYAWITTDDEGALGFNAMTGTLPAFRHRGLAKLAKAVSIRWARDHGVRVLYTSNDHTNLDMLGLNRSLGYHDAGVWDTYAREEG